MPRKKKTKVEEVVLEDEFNITIDLINKERGEKIFRSLLDDENQVHFEGGLSSGSLGLDYAINPKVGGMKWGQLLQLYGVRSGGKSTISLGFAANCTHQKKQVLYLDLEGSMDEDMVLRAGIDPDYFHFVDEDGSEAALIIERAMRAGNVGLVVIDSIAVWEPEVVSKKGKVEDMVDFTKPKIALQGGFLTQVIKKLCRTARKTGTIIVSINQVRSNLDPYSGEPTLVPYGPKALEHAISVQCLVKGKPRGEKNVILDVDGELIGQYTTVKVDKNKTAVPMKEVKVPLIFGRGVDPYMELVVLAQEWDIISGIRGNFKWVDTGESICRGTDNFVQMLCDDAEFYTNLRDQVIEVMGIKYQEPPVNSYIVRPDSDE